MGQLKTVLLNQYIGAIGIGYLIGRGAEAFFAGFMPSINAILTELVSGHGFVGGSAWMTARISMASNLILATMYFTVAFLMASWLYRDPSRR